MRYFEYVYLLIAVGLVFFLATNSKYLSTPQMIAVVVGTVISSFMYSFRRNQRRQFEEEDRKWLEEQEKEAGQDDD